MGYLVLAVFAALIGLFLAYLAAKLLLKGNWLLGWLRGMLGVALLAGVILLACVAFDIYSYRQLQVEQNIATISFRQLDQQHFTATFVESNGSQQLFELQGDQWQLDSRIIKWHGIISRMGMKTGYRLERISGRYLSLDDERTKARSAHELAQRIAGVDVWNWLKEFNADHIIDARYGNSTFLPMVDGGQYQISVSTSGLLARPINQPAEDAVNQWQ
jgi:hypothetical protein